MRYLRTAQSVVAILATYVMVAHAVLFGLQAGAHASAAFDPFSILCAAEPEQTPAPAQSHLPQKECPCGAMCVHGACAGPTLPGNLPQQIDWHGGELSQGSHRDGWLSAAPVRPAPVNAPRAPPLRV